MKIRHGVAAVIVGVCLGRKPTIVADNRDEKGDRAGFDLSQKTCCVICRCLWTHERRCVLGEVSTTGENDSAVRIILGGGIFVFLCRNYAWAGHAGKCRKCRTTLGNAGKCRKKAGNAGEKEEEVK